MNDNSLQLNETDIDKIQHNSIKLSGTFTALVTPFTKDGDVDYDGLSSIVEFQIKEGIDGLFIHPIAGPKKPNDFDSNLLLHIYEMIINKYPRHGYYFARESIYELSIALGNNGYYNIATKHILKGIEYSERSIHST